MLFLFIIMLLDIDEFDEGFEFKETQVFLVLISFKLWFLFEKTLFFGESVVDVSLTEFDFSIYEFFIYFYNINYILLIFIAILLFFIMISVVDSLLNNYSDVLSIHKHSLGLIVYSGFVFWGKRDYRYDYGILEAILIMPIKYVFTGRWGWDLYAAPYDNKDPAPIAPPLLRSQMDYFDNYIQWDWIQDNYIKTNLFKYILHGDALIGYFVLCFVIIMLFFWLFSFVSAFRFSLLFTMTWFFLSSILYNLSVYYPDVEKIRYIQNDPTEGNNPFLKGVWHELFFGERPFFLRFLEFINPINEPLLANYTFVKYDFGLLVFYGSIGYVFCFILICYLCKYHFEGSWAPISIFLVIWFIEGASVAYVVTPLCYFFLRLGILGLLIFARGLSALFYESHHQSDTILGRGLFLYYELQMMKRIDKIITHTYYIGFFFSSTYIFAVWNWNLIGTDILYILFFNYNQFKIFHVMLLLISIFWGIFVYCAVCRSTISSRTFGFFTTIEGVSWLTFCLLCCGVVWTVVSVMIFGSILWFNNFLFDHPFYEERTKKTFERMAPVIEAELRSDEAEEEIHRIFIAAERKKRRELWKKLSWKQKINIVWQRTQRFWKFREPVDWANAGV